MNDDLTSARDAPAPPANDGSSQLSEFSLSSEALDCQPSTGPTRRLLICTTPRSGSYLLSRLLTDVGIGVPHEYLNPINVRPIRSRVPTLSPGSQVDSDYLGWLDQYRTTANGVFAAKVHFNQLESNLHVVPRWVIGPVPPVVVYLRRRGLSAQTHSLLRSAQTGVWDSSGTATTAPPSGVASFGFDDVDRLSYLLVYWNAMWQYTFEAWNVDPVEVVYEDLVRDQARTVQTIASRLGVSAASPVPERSPVVDPHVAGLRQQEIDAYARSWAAGTASPARSRRRFVQAGAVDLIRAAARSAARRRRPRPDVGDEL